jgi:hypothetical protein
VWPDGTILHLKAYGQVIRDMNGNPVRMIGINHDITERVRAESQREAALEALRESEERYRLLSESTQDMIYVIDRDDRVEYVNAAAARALGMQPQNVIGKAHTDLFPLENAKEQRLSLQKAFASSEPFSSESHLISSHGETWISTQLVPFRREGEKVTAVMGVSRDITERKQMEDSLRDLNATLEQRVADRTRRLYEANAQLSELDQLKDQFISRISHELRTPLTNIISYLDLLEHGKPEKHAQYLQVINEQTALLHKLIESLLEVTQKSVNAAGVHVAPTDLNQLAAALLTEIAPRAAQRGLLLTSALTPELPFVSADGRLLAQAMSKLAANALNYTPAGGTIDLATAEVIDAGATWITFTIRDSGPGITPDELAHIFDRFYRGRAAADYKTPGVGLGLSVSRDILTSLDGRLTVDSQPGEGATFTAWLRPA